MKKVKIKAYAKINLALDVLGLLDDGYHEVEMIMQGIDLYDQIEIALTPKVGIHLVCSGADLGPVEENLAYKAARLLLTENGIKTGLNLKIKKNIPVAAGLAGGSTDGAAVLLGLNQLLDLQLSRDKLHHLAARLGSDVPFCLYPTTALARGRGELLSAVPSPKDMWMVLFKPEYGVSTAIVYKNLSKVLVENRPDIMGLLGSLAESNLEKAYQQMANVLEYSTFDLYPQLREQARKIEGLGAKRVMMTGSGPTLVAYTGSKEEALELAGRWFPKDWRIIVTRTINEKDLQGRMKIDEGEENLTVGSK